MRLHCQVSVSLGHQSGQWISSCGDDNDLSSLSEINRRIKQDKNNKPLNLNTYSAQVCIYNTDHIRLGLVNRIKFVMLCCLFLVWTVWLSLSGEDQTRTKWRKMGETHSLFASVCYVQLTGIIVYHVSVGSHQYRNSRLLVRDMFIVGWDRHSI